jgi:hypothetical protein
MKKSRHRSVILNLDTRWRFVVSFSPCLLISGKQPLLFNGAKWAPEQVWWLWGKVIILALPGIESQVLGHHSVRSLAPLPTELSRFPSTDTDLGK